MNINNKLDAEKFQLRVIGNLVGGILVKNEPIIYIADKSTKFAELFVWHTFPEKI